MFVIVKERSFFRFCTIITQFLNYVPKKNKKNKPQEINPAVSMLFKSNFYSIWVSTKQIIKYSA